MPHEVVWVAYEKKSPHLPRCIASNVAELAMLVGVSRSTIESSWSRFRRGESKYTTYAKVYIGDDDREE